MKGDSKPKKAPKQFTKTGRHTKEYRLWLQSQLPDRTFDEHGDIVLVNPPPEPPPEPEPTPIEPSRYQRSRTGELLDRLIRLNERRP